MGLCTKVGYDMSKGSWDMGLLPVWRLGGQIWLAVAGKRFWIWKVYQMFCIKHGRKIMCAKFHFSFCSAFLLTLTAYFEGFWHKPRWRKINHGAKWRYMVRWTRLGSRNLMIPGLWILDEWVKSYKHECMWINWTCSILEGFRYRYK